MVRVRDRVLSVVCAIMLAISLCPGVAFASVFDDIVKEYRYMESEGFEVPQSITEDGTTYHLLNATDPVVDPEWKRPSKEASSSETKSIPAKDLNRAASYFDSEKAYSDNEGFEGTLKLAGVKTTPEYEVLTRQVDRTYVYTGLASNDANQIPTTRNFTVSSGSAPGATTTKALTLSDCQFVVESYSANGLPESYKAYVDYRGQEEYVTIPGYTAVATYEATVELTQDNLMLITATYGWALPEWVLIAAGLLAATAVATATYFFFVWYRNKRAILYRVEEDSETQLERIKVAKVDTDKYAVDIPGDIVLNEMTDEYYFALQFPKKYLGKQVTATQNELVLYNGEAQERVRLVNPVDM